MKRHNRRHHLRADLGAQAIAAVGVEPPAAMPRTQERVSSGMAASASSDTTGGAPSSAHNAAASTARTSRISTAHPSEHMPSPSAKSASSTTRNAASHTARLIPPKLHARSHGGFRAWTPPPYANHGGVAASSALTQMLCCPVSFVSSACAGMARHGMARHSTAWYGIARHGMAQHGMA